MSKNSTCSEIELSIPREYAALRALWATVILQAISDFQNKAVIDRKHRKSAREWIGSNETGYPNSFVNICDYLDISPHHIRKRVGLNVVLNKTA